MASISSVCMSRTEARMVTVRSVSTLHVQRRGQRFPAAAALGLDGSTVAMTLAPGWRLMFRMTPERAPARAWRPRRPGAIVLGVVHRGGHVGQAHRVAVLEGDDQLAVLGGGHQLVVGIYGGAALGASKPPLAALTLAAAIELRRSPASAPGRPAPWVALYAHGWRRPPPMVTRPTPWTCESLGARRFSTRSFTRITGSVGEGWPASGWARRPGSPCVQGRHRQVIGQQRRRR